MIPNALTIEDMRNFVNCTNSLYTTVTDLLIL